MNEYDVAEQAYRNGYSNAIKEFAENVKAAIYVPKQVNVNNPRTMFCEGVCFIIDKLAKEMTESVK